ncbi:MAG: hypothetical protein Fues2KO_11830 [Fuerstiella sp.]
MLRILFSSISFVLVCGSCCFDVAAADDLRVATFDVDASPPIGSPMAYDPTKEVTTPLSARGIVLFSDQKPIVLCALDWLGVANEAHSEFRERLAQAAGTSVDRVCVHTLHQHDAPRCDFTTEAILAEFGHGKKYYDDRFARDVFMRTSEAVRNAVQKAMAVSELGLGEAEVQKVASNRRILGEDGKVKYTRFTACRDPKIRAMPVGTIDPMLKLITFRAADGRDLANLTFYATHPQSYYRTGQANPDFPGLARNAFQSAQKTNAIHFNGAGGNIGAGKWNDGSHENRQVLADRMLTGMQQAADARKFESVDSTDLRWTSTSVTLPLGKHLVESDLTKVLSSNDADGGSLKTAAKHLAWLRRTQAGHQIDIGCLAIGDARILFLPGELFVEYQLAAQQMAPDLFVAMAAYGEYGPGYIGTDIAYTQGGYESSERASRVSPGVEQVLMNAMEHVLDQSSE